jgi:hypothetical protein
MLRDPYSPFMEVSMRRIIVGMVAIAIVAAPCVYDAFSPEPSPLAGLFALLAISGNFQQ